MCVQRKCVLGKCIVGVNEYTLGLLLNILYVHLRMTLNTVGCVFLIKVSPFEVLNIIKIKVIESRFLQFLTYRVYRIHIIIRQSRGFCVIF